MINEFFLRDLYVGSHIANRSFGPACKDELYVRISFGETFERKSSGAAAASPARFGAGKIAGDHFDGVGNFGDPPEISSGWIFLSSDGKYISYASPHGHVWIH